MSIKLESASSSSSSSSTRRKSEAPSQTFSLQSSATSLTSISDITLESAEYNSTSSTPRRNSVRTSAKRKRNPDYRNDASVYHVAHILAKSFEKSLGPNRQMEHQYLVRWEGYGPKDDTWEYRSNLMAGASMLVKEFESKPYPFYILDSRSTGNTTRYLVRYGAWVNVEPSPFYAIEWHTKNEMTAVGGLEREDIDQAVDDHHEEPSSDTAVRLKKAEKSRAVHLKGRHILEIMGRKDWKPRKDQKGHTTRYHVKWKDGRTSKDDWLTYHSILRKFGKTGQQFLKEWNEEMGHGSSNKKHIMTTPVGPLSEYELERRQNMDANRELMMQLGLSL